MGKLFLLCAVILACASIEHHLEVTSCPHQIPPPPGSALNCYQCDYISFNCKKNVTCKPGEVCATIQGSAVGRDLIKKRDCVRKETCNTNSTEKYLSFSYTTTVKCCDGDTCNSATMLSSAHLYLSMALAMLGFWFIQLL